MSRALDHARLVIRTLKAADVPPVDWAIARTPVNHRPFPFGATEVPDLAAATRVARAYADALGADMPELTEGALEHEATGESEPMYVYVVMGRLRGILVLVNVVIDPRPAREGARHD
jgi:hypothetical protein